MALPRTPPSAACLCVVLALLLPPLPSAAAAAAGTPPDVAKDSIDGCSDGNCSEIDCPADSILSTDEGNVTCLCDLENCTQPTCDGREAQLLHKAAGLPGDCCDVFECPATESTNYQCSWNNEWKKNGTVWSKDDCTVCRCEDGIVVCTEKEVCPEIPASCPEKHTPKGKCCPVCLTDTPGCVVHSKSMVMKDGEKWQEDPCTTCICTVGKKECWSFMCEIKCSNPKHVENECCPVCEEGEHAHKVSQCPTLNCSQYCPNGLERDNTGCPICQCKQVKEVETDTTPLQPEDNTEGKDEGEEHDYEEEDVDEEQGMEDDDELYPVEELSENMCKTLSGHIFEDGMTWPDGCHQCYCHAGLEMCNVIKCPAIKCDKPIFNPPEDCCPHCQDNAEEQPQHQPTTGCFSVDGLFHLEGEIWSLNTCTRCLCHSGQVMCKAEECPPTPCLQPVFHSDRCCPSCPNFTLPSVEDKEACVTHRRAHGESWREHSCSSCICNDGKTECFSEKCPETQCEISVLIKNQCCPVCLDKGISSSCTVGNITYKSGEKWDEDDCNKCECLNGERFCIRQTCSEKCPNMVARSDCCSTCEDHASGRAPAEGPLFDERTYSIIIGLLFFLVAVMAFYLMWQCYRKKQYKLGSLKSCPSSAYNNYVHRDSFAPPRYTSGDRQSKCEPCHYKYVPTYDTTQFSDFVKSPSFGATEKTALAPV
ncbi:cysteine-rich motor neuron 1 protein-like [Schistocerca gregaria]|uniref:cysteine-rich motor neuron 1 protein-like n=1 Tax=Schistocerca gregaria TaxID=7010 RepID=UPI00211F278F|nr:cysteine-rich motor neuron 1 protein-like [Schistocerca gregaria]